MLGPQDTVKNMELLRILGRAHRHDVIAERVIVEIGAAIVEGRLRPGDDLNSVELARMFGSSRTPVREALLALEREGLVEVPPRRRPRVAELRIEHVREIYEVRMNLYGLVSRLVVERAGDEDLRRLRALHDELAEPAAAGALDRYFWHNVEFRRAEAMVAGNRELIRIVDSLGLRTLQLRHLSLSLPNRLKVSVADHERLLLAYEDRDAALAAAINQAILRHGLEAVERSGWTGLPSPAGAAPAPARSDAVA
jgi:DNA-binding GntR family transcriptional regulator